MFSFILAVGAGLGLFSVYQAASPRQAEQRFNAAALALLGGLIGARLGYVLLNPAAFAGRPLDSARLWLGGMVWPGALLGVLPVMLLLTRRQRVSFAELADGLAPLLPPLAVAVWLGCWHAGYAYGPLARPGDWWALVMVDDSGLRAARLPLQPLAALTLLAGFALAQLALRGNLRPGRTAALFGLVLFAHNLLFSLWIVEPAPLWRGLRIETAAAALLAPVCLVWIAATLRRGRLMET